MVVSDWEYTRSGVFRHVFGNDVRIQLNTHIIHAATLSWSRYLAIHANTGKYVYYDEYTLNTGKYMYREQTPPLWRANPPFPVRSRLVWPAIPQRHMSTGRAHHGPPPSFGRHLSSSLPTWITDVKMRRFNLHASDRYAKTQRRSTFARGPPSGRAGVGRGQGGGGK